MLLPPPTRTGPRQIGNERIFNNVEKSNIPPYGSRSSYLPRNPEDFGDGGAFPEIHIKQYPLDQGRSKAGKSNTVAVRTDADGSVRFDAILRQGMRKDKKLFSTYQDLVPKESAIDELMKPTQEEIEEETEKTRLALQKQLQQRLATVAPRSGATKKQDGPVYIKYTPGSGLNPDHNSGANTRIIKLHEMPVDPLEPPKFKISKGPAAPPSPPVPVMHSPPRKVTMKDQQNWKVPPCVSNWKNNRGYVIPLHQRVAADGRYLKESSINDKFAKLTEALYIAEREARAMVETRARQVRKKMRDKRSAREEDLRDMAKNVMHEESSHVSTREVDTPRVTHDRGIETPAMNKQDLDQVEERNRIREERKRERRRTLAQERRKNPSGRDRNQERDISEKIALGQTSGKTTGGNVYDSRLFDKDSGIDSGFGADDSYNLYNKPLFNNTARTIYKPTALGDVDDLRAGGATMGDDTSKFKADRGFEGTKEDRRSRGAQPVEFERDADEQAPEPKRKRRRRSRSRSRDRR